VKNRMLSGLTRKAEQQSRTTEQENKMETEKESRFENSAEKRAAAKKRLEKVWNLYQKPGTEGEKTAAWAKVQEILPRCTLCQKVGKQDSTDISCITCSGIVRTICDWTVKETIKKAAEAKAAGAGKAKGRKETVVYDKWIAQFIQNVPKDAVLREMMGEMSLTAAARLYNNLSCCYGAIKNPNKKDSLVYIAARYFLGLSTVKPEGDKFSIRCVQKAVESWLRVSDK
jgi:hypothetical protein